MSSQLTIIKNQSPKIYIEPAQPSRSYTSVRRLPNVSQTWFTFNIGIDVQPAHPQCLTRPQRINYQVPLLLYFFFYDNMYIKITIIITILFLLYQLIRILSLRIIERRCVMLLVACGFITNRLLALYTQRSPQI